MEKVNSLMYQQIEEDSQLGLLTVWLYAITKHDIIDVLIHETINKSTFY